MRLLCCLFSLCLLASSGIQSVHGRLGDVKQTVLEEGYTDEPTVDPTVYPTEVQTDEPTVDPTIYPTEFVPIPVIMGDGNGAACEPYQLFDGQQICEFQFCDGGSVTITQCSEDFSGDTTYGFPSCNIGQGSNFDLYLDGNYVTGATSTGTCGCPEIVYELSSGCSVYQIVQTCSGGGECSGTTVVYATPVATVVNGDTGGACDAFTIDGTTNWEPVTCEFDVCGFGTYTISQCSMTGSLGLATCSGSEATTLELYQDSTLLSSSTTSSCNCPKIIYELTECRRYSVVQSCTSYGMDCSGVTVIAPYSPNDAEPTDDDNIAVGTFVSAEGAGGICDYFSIDQYSDQDVACQFEACAPFVITQCPDDGFVSDGGTIPHPYGSSNSRIELYSMDDPSTLLSWDQISGPCGSPKLSYTPPDSTCVTYKVRQTCGNGATICDGRTAIYTPSTSTAIVIDASVGGMCDEFILNNINNWEAVYCEFEACDGETVVMSMCSDGSAYCSSDDVELTLMDEGMVIKSSTVAACGCPKIVHTFNDLGGMCHTYRVRQESTAYQTDAQGRTKISLSTGTDDDTVIDNDDAAVGTFVTATGAGGICDYFSIDSNSDQDIACQFEACEAFVITQCTEDGFESDGFTIPHPSGSSSNRIELYSMNDPATMLAFDEGSGPCMAPKLTFTPTETGCVTYKIRQTCSSGNTNCDGRTAIYTPTVSADPISSSGTGAVCSPFGFADDSGGQMCDFTSCGGMVTISQCPEDYLGSGTPSCTGNTGMALFSEETLLTNSFNSQGACGCAEMVYTLPTDPSCPTYHINQFCSGPNECAGTTAVFSTYVTDDAADDTPSVRSSDGVGAICNPYTISSRDPPSFYMCEFQSCGGSVTISQCAEGYTGAGHPTCGGGNTLELYYQEGFLDSATSWDGTGPCDCPTLVYTFPDSGCLTYQLKQSCSFGGCDGTTAVFSTPAVAPATRINVDTGGGLCDPFSTTDGSVQSCEFEACGGSVTITMCAAAFQGTGTPTCSGNTLLELFVLDGGYLTNNANGGACDCSEIVYTLPETCQVYEIVQGCSYDDLTCSGTTAVFTTPIDADDGDGEVCRPFEVVDGVGEKFCEFKSCGAEVVVSQCPTGYMGAGTPTCEFDTKLEVYLDGSVIASDESSGGCGCSTVTFQASNADCFYYQVKQTCAAGVTSCAGTTAVYTIVDNTDDDWVPAPVGTKVYAAGEGELCDSFTIVPGGDFDYYICPFEACGGSVTISMCPEGFAGDGNPTCDSAPFMEVYDDSHTWLANDVDSGSCGCPSITYTFPDGCKEYTVEQACTNSTGGCSGTTVVFATPEVVISIDADGEGGLCTPFEVIDGVGERICQIMSCGAEIVVTQCPDGYLGAGTPTCAPDTRLEVYFDEEMLAFDEGPGACGCPTITFWSYDDDCYYYHVKQKCTAGVENCSGTTAVFAMPPTAEPSAAPTSSSTAPHTYTVRNGFAFAVPAGGENLFTLGEAPHGGLMSGDVDFNSFASPVNYIVASRFAFVAVLNDQTYVSWGAASALAGVAVDYVHSVVANEAAFAGINVATGGVFAMGSKHNGGNVVDNARCNGFATQLSSAVSSVVASSCSFTAIKFDGSVYTWGNTHCGGGTSSETRTDLVNVQKVFATREAFAAILPGGVVKTWGGAYAGGDSTSVASALSSAEVVAVFAGRSVFVAHTATGGLIAWGYRPHGGDLSAVQGNVNSNVVHVAFTFTACAALKSNGDVLVWGRADSGGDASAVAGGLHDIVSVHGNSKAFAAITTTGSVVTWGKAEFGGAIPADKLADLSSGVVAIYHTDRAFAALKDDGQLVVWGQAGHGGSPSPTIEMLLLSGVTNVYANDAAFAVVKGDGSVVAWGHPVPVPVPGVQLVSELLTSEPTAAPTAEGPT